MPTQIVRWHCIDYFIFISNNVEYHIQRYMYQTDWMLTSRIFLFWRFITFPLDLSSCTQYLITIYKKKSLLHLPHWINVQHNFIEYFVDFWIKTVSNACSIWTCIWTIAIKVIYLISFKLITIQVYVHNFLINFLGVIYSISQERCSQIICLYYFIRIFTK